MTTEQIERLAVDVCGSDIHTLGTWHSMGVGRTFDPSKYSDHNAILVQKFIDNIIPQIQECCDDFEIRIFAQPNGWVCLTMAYEEYESDKWRGEYTKEKCYEATCLAMLSALDSPPTLDRTKQIVRTRL